MLEFFVYDGMSACAHPQHLAYILPCMHLHTCIAQVKSVCDARNAQKLLCVLLCVDVIVQTLLAMAAYAGLFSVPWLYKQFRNVIDRVVYDTMHFLTLLLVNAERWAYAIAFLAAAVVWHLLEPTDSATTGASFVVRCTAAFLAGFAVLMWRLMVTE